MESRYTAVRSAALVRPWLAAIPLTAALTAWGEPPPRERELPLGGLRVSSPAPIRRDHPVTYTMHLGDPAALLGQLGEYHPSIAASADTVAVTVDYANAPSCGPPEARHRQPSWVVDYDEGPVEDLAELARATWGEAFRGEELAELVYGYLEPRFGSFEVASKAARTRTGDCTEHAVLLAALARRFGMPARVVLGYKLLDGVDLIIGHAWVEVYRDGRWAGLDPTTGDRPVDNGYLALGVLSDEGPGFLVSTVELLAILDVERFEVAQP